MKNEIKIIICAIGVAISALFILCSGSIYQALYLGNPDFTEGLEYFRTDIRQEGWSVELAAITTFLPWLFAILYYYIINSVRFDRWWNWLTVLVLVIIVTPYASLSLLQYRENLLEPGLADVYSQLNLAMTVWSALLAALMFTLSSYSCRWWSTNCRHTPIPQ